MYVCMYVCIHYVCVCVCVCVYARNLVPILCCEDDLQILLFSTILFKLMQILSPLPNLPCFFDGDCFSNYIIMTIIKSLFTCDTGNGLG